MRRISVSLLAIGAMLLAGPALAAKATDGLKAGKAELRSAGRLAFGPDGLLFVGDSAGASIYALDTRDTAPVTGATSDVAGVDAKVAALLGTTADQILINAVAVNPLSKRAYLAVSRGRGPEATAVIVRTAAGGKLETVSLDNIPHSKIALPNAAGETRQGGPITDMAYVNGKVFVAGLSTEEFASNLRTIPYPFSTVDRGTSVEIFHGAHGRFETAAPVRTFVPYKIDGADVILAAYTCTPLVVFRTDELKSGNKVQGKTIAELGNGNQPLDMIAYKKNGADYFLINNSRRGVMKLSAANLGTYKAITAQTDVTGVPYETIADIKDVVHLAQVDDSHAVMLVKAEGGSDLKTIMLP